MRVQMINFYWATTKTGGAYKGYGEKQKEVPCRKIWKLVFQGSYYVWGMSGYFSLAVPRNDFTYKWYCENLTIVLTPGAYYTPLQMFEARYRSGITYAVWGYLKSI
jgi:hypothetical protein